MQDVRQIREERKKYNMQMFRSGIGTFRALEELETEAFADGALSQKHKELIGLGISIATSCYG